MKTMAPFSPFHGRCFRIQLEIQMTRSIARTDIKAALLSAGLLFAPLGVAAAQQATPVKHHSVVKGAVAGAVVGHMTHRKHGAVLGAAVGAEVQHHRNKVAKKHAANNGY
jgi:Glycine zipper 2TM domain